LGELERAVMAQLWSAEGPLTVRDVHDRLERELAYTTVMTVLGRLAKKGLVRQERDGKAYRYAAASSRDQMAASLMLDALGAVGVAAVLAGLIVVRLVVVLVLLAVRTRVRRSRHRDMVDLLARAEQGDAVGTLGSGTVLRVLDGAVPFAYCVPGRVRSEGRVV